MKLVPAIALLVATVASDPITLNYPVAGTNGYERDTPDGFTAV
jgi:hypothetical protein